MWQVGAGGGSNGDRWGPGMGVGFAVGLQPYTSFIFWDPSMKKVESCTLLGPFLSLDLQIAGAGPR